MRRLSYLLVPLCLAGCNDTLVGHLTETQANRIATELNRFGIDAKRSQASDQSWALSVAHADQPIAAGILAAYDLPADAHTDLGALFKREGLVSSPTEERVRYTYGVGQELSQTLERMDGVLLARVHVVIPEKDPVTDIQAPPSSAVLVRYRSDVNLESRRADIRALVAAGVEGMKPEQVALTLIAVRPELAAAETSRPAP